MSLTPKQYKFARNVINGDSYAEAYRKAYNAGGMSDRSVFVEGSRVAKHRDVAHEIEKGIEACMNEAIWSRKKAIERLKVVNDRCLDAISSQEVIEAPLLRGFMDSLSELNRLSNVDAEIELDRERRFKTESLLQEKEEREKLERSVKFDNPLGLS